MSKRLILIIAVLLLVYNGAQNHFKEYASQPIKNQWDLFVLALIEVESENDPFAVGSYNDVGILQITPIYVKDVNRILGEDRYSLDHRTDIAKSLEMFEIMQVHYNPERDIERAIKLHNPKAGSEYREKILNRMSGLSEKLFLL